MRICIGGAWKSASLFVGVAGAWKSAAVSIGVGGAWKADADAFGGGGGDPTMSVAISPKSRSAVRYGAGTLTTGAVVANVSGGTAPYTYSWGFKSGDHSVSVTSVTAQSTAGTGSVLDGDTKFAVFTCTVTDSLGATASDDATFILTETH